MAEKQMKCCIFSRTSTTQQDVVQQTEALKEEARRLGYDAQHQVIVEYQESGIKLGINTRVGIQNLKQSIECDKSIDCVICWELTRIARRADVIYNIRDFLVEHKIRWVVCKPFMELIDSSGQVTQVSSLMLGIFTSFAESEMALKKERFKRAKDAMREQGKWCGGPVMYGYRKNKDKYLDIYEPEAKYVREIFEKYATGSYSLEKLYTEYVYLGIFENVHKTVAQSRIREIIHHLGYSGRSELRYPMIVTPEMQDKCIKVMGEKKNSWQTRSKNLYFAKGLCRCAECGKMMIANSNANIFKCKGYYHDDNKENNVINANVLDTVLWECARTAYNWRIALFRNKSILEHDQRMKEKEIIIQNIDKMIRDVEQKQERAFNSYVDGKVADSVYNKMVDKLKTEHDTLKKKRESEYAKLCEYKSVVNGDGSLSAVAKIDDIENDEEKNTIIHELIDSVRVKKYDDRQEIYIDYKGGVLVAKETYQLRRFGHKLILYRINEDGTKDGIDIVKRFENNKWRKYYTPKS